MTDNKEREQEQQETATTIRCPKCHALFGFDETDPKCDRCRGTGEVCAKCKGMGYVYGEKGLETCGCNLVGQRLADDLSELSSLRGWLLNARFGNFYIDAAPLATEAHLAVSKWAKDPQGWLTVTGTKGNGKTHLAAATANWLIKNGRACVIIKVPELMAFLKETFDGDVGETAFSRIDRVRKVDVLIIDDLGVEYRRNGHAGSQMGWVDEQLYLILDYRSEMRKPTLITTNIPIEALEPRIRSRIQEYPVVQNYAPDYRRGDGEVTNK